MWGSTIHSQPLLDLNKKDTPHSSPFSVTLLLGKYVEKKEGKIQQNNIDHGNGLNPFWKTVT